MIQSVVLWCKFRTLYPIFGICSSCLPKFLEVGYHLLRYSKGRMPRVSSSPWSFPTHQQAWHGGGAQEWREGHPCVCSHKNTQCCTVPAAAASNGDTSRPWGDACRQLALRDPPQVVNGRRPLAAAKMRGEELYR